MSETFSLTSNNYKFTTYVFPVDAKNELIIGPLNKDVFCLFNGKLITHREAQKLNKNKVTEIRTHYYSLRTMDDNYYATYFKKDT